MLPPGAVFLHTLQMRVAWIGPTPTRMGGVSFAGGQLVRSLSRRGMELDCHVVRFPGELEPDVAPEPGLSFVEEAASWDWDAWYARHPLSRFVLGQAARARAQATLVTRLLKAHRERPYDLVYQFSQLELFALRRHAASLPPIVVHPEVHAAGELRWHRREKALSRRAEPLPLRLGARAMLAARARVQRRDMRFVSGVIAPSATFGQLLIEDYGIGRDRVHVVPNPIDVDRFHLAPRPAEQRPAKLLFVSRLSVRKGVDQIVGLSHRLDDLRDEVEITVVGDHTLWSDYRTLLDHANPRVLRYLGPLPPEQLAALMRDGLALLAPSRYEPFGLTVSEALASGLPVIVSDAVGAREGVDPRCCRMVPGGDADSLESAVRRLLADLSHAGHRDLMAERCRAEATRLWTPEVVGARLDRALSSIAGARR